MDPHHQNSSFQSAGARLVSNPIIPADRGDAPTQQQQQAIDLLKDEDDRCIFACLDLVRSLEPRLQHCSTYACLTRNQVHAIIALRHCKNNEITAWLHLARAPGASRAPSLSPSRPVLSRALDQGHTTDPVVSDASTPDPVHQSFDHQSNQQGNSQDSSTQPSPTSTTTPPQAKPKYCCTLCDRRRPFKNQSDWKKHEKEHDTDYICMLGGPKEATPQGIQCAFCGIQDPDDAHLSGHNAQACSPGSPGLPEAFSRKRRYDMVSHLRVKHGINIESQGEAIAEKWKYTVKKQAWSCCFCVNAFASFNERLNHIAVKHYEHGHTIEDWDATNVIEGLLQQPGLTEAWQTKLRSLSDFMIADIIWERDAIKDLQHLLEVGPSEDTTPEFLVDAAYSACRLNWGMKSKRPRAVVESQPEMDGTSDRTSRPLPAPTSSPPMFVPNHNQPSSPVREPDGLYFNGPADQEIQQVDDVDNSGFLPDWIDDMDEDSLTSTDQYQV